MKTNQACTFHQFTPPSHFRDTMEVSVRNDPELATEVITLLGKELKSARERIRELEGQIRQGVSTRLGLSLFCVLIYRVE